MSNWISEMYTSLPLRTNRAEMEGDLLKVNLIGMVFLFLVTGDSAVTLAI